MKTLGVYIVVCFLLVTAFLMVMTVALYSEPTTMLKNGWF